VILFAFQIYSDFSGYSDIATGTAKLFGFRLMPNFAFPYFSKDMNEFWRRWHISLSTWFRDYLYIPLGGSRGSRLLRVRNTFITFLFIGLWHGANWTFIVWGSINTLFLIPNALLKDSRINIDIRTKDHFISSLIEFLKIGKTFSMVLITWIFFRAESLQHAFGYLQHLFSPSIFSVPKILPWDMIMIIALFLRIEWLQRQREHAFSLNHLNLPLILRWTVYLSAFYLTLKMGVFEKNEFIYFAF
jgi:D-alanyl-lipoteichoic acid acyltransferase DltB (MBOAT superfamily)